MTMGLSMAETALRIGKSYDWLRKHWRALPGFPRPFLGAEPGQHPRWAESAIEAFITGGGIQAAPIVDTRPQQPAAPAANDARPSLAQRLLTLAGS